MSGLGKVTESVEQDDDAAREGVSQTGRKTAHLWVSIGAMIVALIPSQALAGFGLAQWGMTPEQVAAAMGTQAPLDSGSAGEQLEGKTIGNTGTHEFKGRPLRAVYYYDERGLTMVRLRGNPRECEAMYRDLATMYGAPYRVSNQIILKLFIWHDPPANNRLRLMVSKSICNLHYERLDDYKAVDDEQAAKGR